MKCPGQDTRFWGLDAIFEEKCPECGHEMEFFRDDTWRTCSKCGSRVQNPRMNFGCAAHCPYAEQCIGSLPPELLAQKDGDLKDRLAVAAKKLMRGDFKLIARSVRLARKVEELCSKEQLVMGPMLAAAYFLPYLLEVGKNEGQEAATAALATIREIILENGGSQELTDEAITILENQLAGVESRQAEILDRASRMADSSPDTSKGGD